MTPPLLRNLVPGLSGQGVILAATADAPRIEEALHGVGYAVTHADLSSPCELGSGELGSGEPESGKPESGELASGELESGEQATVSLRTAQAAVARALRLPEAAGRNLDALVDSLRDLATWWPEEERVALLLHRAEALVEADLPGWHTLTEILREASRDLWRGGEPGDRVFETVALIDRHGVPALSAEEEQR